MVAERQQCRLKIGTTTERQGGLRLAEAHTIRRWATLVAVAVADDTEIVTPMKPEAALFFLRSNAYGAGFLWSSLRACSCSMIWARLVPTFVS
jgi:hypothetical protein